MAKAKDKAPGAAKTLFLAREHKMTLWAAWDYHRVKSRGETEGATLFTATMVSDRFQGQFEDAEFDPCWLKELADKKVLAYDAGLDCYRIINADLAERVYREVQKQLG